MTNRQIYKDFKKIRGVISSPKTFSVIRATVKTHYPYCYDLLPQNFWAEVGYNGLKKRIAIIDKEIELYKNKIKEGAE